LTSKLQQEKEEKFNLSIKLNDLEMSYKEEHSDKDQVPYATIINLKFAIGCLDIMTTNTCSFLLRKRAVLAIPIRNHRDSDNKSFLKPKTVLNYNYRYSNRVFLILSISSNNWYLTEF